MTHDTAAQPRRPRLRMVAIALTTLFCAPIILVVFLANVSRSR